MFKRFLFLSVSLSLLIGNAYAQKIEDLSVYISDLESKLACPLKVKEQGLRINLTDIFDRKVQVLYTCINNKPSLESSILVDERERMILEVSKTVFDTGEVVTREQYLDYYENDITSKTEQHIFKTGGKEGLGRLTSIYLEYSKKSEMTKRKVVSETKTSEELWEYHPNGAVSKHVSVTISDRGKEELTLEYNELGQKVKETELIYDKDEEYAYKRSVTDYEPKTQKVIQSVSYDCEDGKDKIKTVYAYEKGKLVSQTFYELIYDDNGNLVHEKRIGKDTF